MNIFYRTHTTGIPDEVCRSVSGCGYQEMIYIVDLGVTVKYKVEWTGNVIGTGRYVVVGVYKDDVGNMEESQDDLVFEISPSIRNNTSGDNVVNSFTGIALFRLRTGVCLACNRMLNASSLVKENYIENLMMDLDLRGIEYKVVNIQSENK